MFSDHDETSPSLAAVSAPLVTCSMLAVQQQKRLCSQFVDVSAAQPGCYTIFLWLALWSEWYVQCMARKTGENVIIVWRKEILPTIFQPLSRTDLATFSKTNWGEYLILLKNCGSLQGWILTAKLTQYQLTYYHTWITEWGTSVL